MPSTATSKVAQGRLMASVTGAIKAGYDALMTLFRTTGTERLPDPMQAHYDRLEAAYLNSGVYSDLATDTLLTENSDLQALRTLRNAAHRTTEFYPAKLVISEWINDLERPEDAAAETTPIPDDQPDPLRDAIELIHQASNLDSEGRPFVRQFAMLGDLFVKLSNREDITSGEITAVYMERIDPRHVTDFDKDERGYFTWLRLDTPKTRRLDSGDTEDYTLTEVWSKQRRDYRRWEHDQEIVDDLSQLKTPDVELTLDVAPGDGSDPTNYTGFDFVPVVHRKFRDIGGPRGLAAFGHALPGIREADRIATKLHDMLFPDVTWTLERTGVGPDGLPLPAIEIEDEAGNTLPDGQGWARGYPGHREASENVTNVGKDRVVRLPSGTSLEPKIPNRNMQPMIDELAAQVAWNEQELPECAYYRLRDLDLSGVAMRTALADVIDRATEAASNLATGLAQAEDMALTISQVLGLEGFDESLIGTWEDGSFEHSYPIPDLFPETASEKAQAGLAEAQAIAAYDAAGLLETGLERLGFPDPAATAEAAKAEKDARQQQALQQAQAAPGAGAAGAPNLASLLAQRNTPAGQSEPEPAEEQ